MFKVFNETESKEKYVYFKLVESDGEVSLVVCNKEGFAEPFGWILCITDRGLLVRRSSVNKDLGLKLDAKGRILLSEPEEE